MNRQDNKKILVIGGGMSGLTTAVEAAEAGCEVVIVEKNPYLGGRAAQLNKYFWKLCPPVCGLEMQFKRLKNNDNLTFYTLAETENISGEEGSFDVTVKINPRYINEKCVGCDACAQACPSYRGNEFNLNMDKTKAAYLPFEQAFPFRYVIDNKACAEDCKRPCFEACKYDAINFDMKPEVVNIKVGSVVMATGWNLYDAAKIDNLGFGNIKNVITNLMMERLAAPNGPTKGRILRPSDSKEIKNIAFVQCAGSRDENHLSYCSYICCLASLKQATYIREQYPEARVQIFYIDIRTPGLYENRFLSKIKADPNVKLTKGKVAKISEDPATQDVIVEVEDIFAGKKIKVQFDMVVLAAGMVPSTKDSKVIREASYTPEGFIDAASLKKGIYAVGTIKSPVDVARSVQDATGAALKGMRSAGKNG